MDDGESEFDLNDLSMNSKRDQENRVDVQRLEEPENPHGNNSPNNRPPPLDLKKAALIQSQYANKPAPQNGEADRDLRVQLNDYRKQNERLTTEKSELIMKLEENLIINQKMSSELSSLKRSFSEASRINALLTKACITYGRKWKQITAHFNYLQSFYNRFGDIFNSNIIDVKCIVKEVKRFKEGFLTERTYNPEVMVPTGDGSSKNNNTKSKIIERSQVTKQMVGEASLRDVHLPNEFSLLPTTDKDMMTMHRNTVQYNNVKHTNIENGGDASLTSGKEAIMRLARDVYSNKQILNIVPDPRGFLEASRYNDKMDINTIILKEE